MLEQILILIAISLVALVAVHTPRLEIAVLGLAGVSALTATALYMMDAVTVGVIELSVGAGLVAVLFAFANSIVEQRQLRLTVTPRLRWVAIILVLIMVLAGVVIVGLGDGSTTGAADDMSFSDMFWEQRSGDVLAQLALIFTTVVGVLSLLAPAKSSTDDYASESEVIVLDDTDAPDMEALPFEYSHDEIEIERELV